MAVDVSRIPNNNKFDPVREAILQLQSDVTSGVAGVGTVNSASGNITITDSGNITVNTVGTTITIGIDDTDYLSLSDTGTQTVTGNIVISGNLTVNGTTVYLNTETVRVEDNIIELNRTPDTPNDTATATTSGIEIYRGNGVTTASFIFDDTDDTWDLTNNLAVAGTITTGGDEVITLGDLSVTTGTASGGGALSYDDTTGVFTFTPADSGAGLTLQQVTANGNTTNYGISTGNITVQPSGTGSGVVTIQANSVGDARLDLTAGTGGTGVIKTTNNVAITFEPNATEKVVIASDGNMNVYEKLAVGKTTAASTYHLEVDGTALARTFKAQMEASGTTYTGTVDQYNNSMQIRTDAGGAISLGGDGPGSVQNNVYIKDGDLDVNGDVTADNFIGDGSQLTNLPSTGTSSDLQDVTDNGATTTNSIAIGKSSAPSVTLDVESSQAGSAMVKFKNKSTATDGYAEMQIWNDADDKLVLGSIGSGYTSSEWANSSYIYDTGQDALRIKASNQLELFAGGYALGYRRLVINSSGLVGIGTDAPTTGYLLDVAGLGKFDNAVSVDAVDTANVTPASNEARLSGYGIIGNRGTFYVTNAGGAVQIGNGTSHNQNPTANFNSSNIQLYRTTYITNGVLGVGTTNPNEEIDVRTSAFTSMSVTSDRNTANDYIGSFAFYGRNTAATPQDILYARMMSQMTGVTSGGERGDILFQTRRDAAYIDSLRISSGGNITSYADFIAGSNVRVSDQLIFDKTNTASGGDYDFINIGYNGSWSQNANGLAAIEVNDGGGTVGKFGITYASPDGGAFVVKNLYNGSGYGGSGEVFRVNGSGNAFIENNLTLDNLYTNNTVYFSRSGAQGNTENFIRSQNYPSQGYTTSAQRYWLEYNTKGGHHFVVNSDGGAGDTENNFDDFTIWQGAVDGDRLFSVSNVGNTNINGSLYASPDGTYDSTPSGTTFTHTLATASGTGTKRVVNFDGNGGNPSVWWTSGNNAIGAIDAMNTTNGLAFWVNSSGGSWQRNFYIDTDRTIFERSVGIGTSNPSDLLHVSGGDVTIGGGGGTIGTSSAIANAYLKIGSTLGFDPNQMLFIGDGYINSTGDLRLAGDGNGATIQMTLNSGGVGINETSPQQALHVGGRVRTTAEVLVNTNRTGIGWVTIAPSSNVFGQIALNVIADSNGSSYYSIRGDGTSMGAFGRYGNATTSGDGVQFYDSYSNADSAYYHRPKIIAGTNDGSTGGVDEADVGLLVHNINGANNTWAKIALGGREASGAGNTVSWAGIAAKKVSGTSGSWARGNLHFWVKNNATMIDAANYNYIGEYTGAYYHTLQNGADIRAGINLRRDLNNKSGISFYNTTYHNWQVYMAPATATGCGANGNLTAPSGISSVSSWALRSRMEGVSTYGWLWETGGSGGGGATATAKMELGATTGTLRVTGDVIAYASDQRLKTNVKPIDNAVDKVKQISGVTYDWVDDIESEYGFHPNTMHEAGVLAQEIEKVLPEAVMTAPMNTAYTEKTGTDHDFKTVKYDRIVPLLIEAIKEQQKQIDELKARLDGSTK